MKTSSLFRLGGLAVLLSAILTGIGRLINLLSAQPYQETTLLIWRGILAGILMVLGLGALFARQSQQGEVLGFVGYIFIVITNIFFIGSDVVDLAVSAGVMSLEQIAQVPSYALSNSLLPWVWVTGLFAFGISVYRAQVFPKYAGALLVLLGLVQPFTGAFFMKAVYAVCYVAAWAWLGWSLLTSKAEA